MKIFTFWDCKRTGCSYDWGWRQKKAKTHKKHHSLQVSITACGNILDPDTGELNSRDWSSQPIATDASGLHFKSLHTTLEEVQIPNSFRKLPFAIHKFISILIIITWTERLISGGNVGGRWSKMYTKKIYSGFFLPGHPSHLKTLVANWSPSMVESKWEVSEIKKIKESTEVPWQHRQQKDLTDNPVLRREESVQCF